MFSLNVSPFNAFKGFYCEDWLSYSCVNIFCRSLERLFDGKDGVEKFWTKVGVI